MNFHAGYENTLHTLFFVCFCVGVGYVAVSVLFSKICERLDALRAVFKPSLMAAFLMVFGGVGLIAQHRTAVAIAAGIAVLAASAATYLLVRYLKT